LRVKGWHNPETGKTYLYVPNVDSFTDAKKTLLHEKVAHEGLPKLLGKDKFNKLCDDVWNVMNKEDKKRFLAYAYNKKKDELTVDDYLNKHKTRQAADEFMASIAEGGIQNPTLWEKIKQLVRNALRSVGINIQLNDADIAYLLYRSRNNLQKGEMTSTDSKRAEIENRFKENKNTIRFRISEEINEMFDKAVAGDLTGKSLSIGKLTPEGKRYLESISGLQLKDDIDFALNPSDLVHIYNEHYGENEKDKGNNIPLNK
jgi:hypothetical protein